MSKLYKTWNCKYKSQMHFAKWDEPDSRLPPTKWLNWYDIQKKGGNSETKISLVVVAVG